MRVGPERSSVRLSVGMISRPINPKAKAGSLNRDAMRRLSWPKGFARGVRRKSSSKTQIEMKESRLRQFAIGIERDESELLKKLRLLGEYVMDD
jgi:hypothetical protein